METRARYVLIGLFTLAVIAAGFGFVYWLHNSAGLGERATYQIRFASPVPGLRAGSSVLFNGIRVGEVTALQLSAADPRQVLATIVVERATPVRADTQVAVESQGLMASPSVTLRGGAAAAPPLPASRGQWPTLVADPSAGLDTMGVAREVLRRIDGILVDNAEPLKDTIANLKTFTDALARNSNRIDGILTGVERMTGAGAPAPAPAVYDLTVPRGLAKVEPLPKLQLAIADPSAVIALDSTQVGIAEANGATGSLPNVKWSDTLTKLVQARVIQGFENAGFSGVARTSENFTSDVQLALDIRKFRLRVSDQAAEAELGVKLLREGKIVDAKVFAAEAMAASASDAAIVTAALNQAFGQIVTELVPWTARAIESVEKNQ
jgi:phospholipid/cholesterol/gamma-HCH transport system substrate-binding protein